MRAVVFDSLGSVADGRLAELREPSPGVGEVAVSVHAVPVNYVDVLTMTGRYQFTPPLPFIPGKGPTGVVVAVGRGVAGLSVGDRVMAMAEHGGYAETALAPAKDVYRLPDTLSFVDAASMAVAYDTAWMALKDRARVRPGETVLVLGATGAVGAAALQLGRAMGADVIAGAANPAALGPDVAGGAVVELSGDSQREDIPRRVAEITGSGVDVVIDMVGGDAFDGAVRALNWRGRIVVVGFAAGRIPVLKINYLLLKNIEVSGIQISDYRKRRPDLMQACYDDMFALFLAGRLQPMPAKTFILDEWRNPVEQLERREAHGRLVLTPVQP